MPPTPTGSNTEQSPHNELRTEEHGPYAPPELGVIHNVKSALKKTDGSDIAVAGSGIDDKDGGRRWDDSSGRSQEKVSQVG